MKFFSRLMLAGILFFFATNVQGQVIYDADPTPYGGLTREARIEIAAESIKAIKEGVLIVRLISNARKISEIDRLLESEEVSFDQKIRLRSMKQQAISEASDVNENLYAKFTETYSFGDVLFMYDTSVYHLTEELEKGYFLDSELNIDPEISLAGRPYRIIRYGPLENAAIRTPQLVIMDTAYQDLPAPFPVSYAPSADFFRFFMVKVDGGKYINKRVSMLDRTLSNFYARCLAKGWLSE